MFPKIVLTVDNEIYGMAGSSKVEDGRCVFELKVDSLRGAQSTNNSREHKRWKGEGDVKYYGAKRVQLMDRQGEAEGR